MPPPLDPDRRAAIAEVLRENHGARSRAAIARDFGVAASTVSKIATDDGIEPAFDRTKTATATRARAVDNASRRAELAAALLDDVQLARDRLRAPYLFVTGTKDGIVKERLPAGDIPAADFRALVGAAKSALDGHVVLDRHDNDGGAAAALSMMGRIAAAIADVGDEPYVDPNVATPRPEAGVDYPEGE